MAALVVVVLAASAGAAFSRHSSTRAARGGGIAAGESRFGTPSIVHPVRGGGLGLLPGHGMTTVIGRPHFVHIRPDAHPTAQRPEGEGESATEEHEPKSPRTPKGPVRLIPHRTVHAVVTKRTASAGAPAAAPSDFVVNTDKDLGCGHAIGYCSLVNEPSVGVHGNSILETWNWSAGWSSDGGANFTYMNPYTAFPGSNLYGGFCCDQLAYYEPTRGLFIWVLQYVQDGTGHNAIRLAVANGDAQLAAGNFFYWDLKPADVGSSAYWYDQPKISASSNYLYMEVSRYAIGANSFGGSVVIRMPLATLAAHGTLTQEAYAPAVFSPGPVQGATSTMYFAGHVNTTTLRLYSWPESAGPAGVTSTDIGHSRYPQVFPYTCPRIGGSANSDWCPRASGTGGFAHDDRINSGWVQNGTIGFSWDASQGSVVGGLLPAFAYPYVHVVRIKESDKTLLDEPAAWSPTYAIEWSALTPNANGDVAGLVEYGGGTTYEHCGAIIHDGFTTPSLTSFWEFHNIASSTADTAAKKSGDYLTIRQNGNSWSGTCYTVGGGGDNGDIHPHYVNFGRAGTPPPPVTQYALSVTKSGDGSGTVASSPAGIDCGATCSAAFNAGTAVTLTASNPGSTFAGWSGAGCSGTGACTVTMSASQTLNAQFNKVGTPPTILSAIVGPGRTIKLTKGGRKVASVLHGKFKIVVQDKTKKDNFHLTCPRVNKKTKVKTKSRTTWNVTLAKGTCSYKSDAHKKLKGSFKVR